MHKTRFEILTLYGLVAACGILGGIPTYDMQNMAMILIIIMLIGLYVLRSREKEDTLLRHHATYMIRTIWIYSFFYVVALSAAVYTVYKIGNTSVFSMMIDSIQMGTIPGHDEMENSVIQMMTDNNQILLSWLALPCLYMLMRVIKGGNRAYRDYRLLNIYSWF
jgi:uncharacterized membrane protein